MESEKFSMEQEFLLLCFQYLCEEGSGNINFNIFILKNSYNVFYSFRASGQAVTWEQRRSNRSEHLVKLQQDCLIKTGKGLSKRLEAFGNEFSWKWYKVFSSVCWKMSSLRPYQWLLRSEVGRREGIAQKTGWKNLHYKATQVRVICILMS